ncbi:MAG TPA: nucleotidyltransferase family protein [Blastocatellia bacterium]|nr:nucleotidyltransferase family protein [Blastocatellia bacterium]
MFSALLLAAGESRRMGEFKQLLTFAGKSFVACCVDNLLASRVSEVVVVTGHRQADVRRAVSDRAVTFAHNEDYREGMSSSIKRGLESVSPSARVLVVALVDQPHIGPAIFNQVIDAYEKDRPLIVVPTYNGRNGHPIAIDLRLKDEILAMDPRVGLKQVVHAHKDKIVYTEAASEAVLIDCDLPEDYRRLLNG